MTPELMIAPPMKARSSLRPAGATAVVKPWKMKRRRKPHVQDQLLDARL
jgi:hypothetical protein